MAAPFEGAPVPAALAGGVSPGFRIITADERLAERRGIKMVIFGKSGIGKTSLLWTARSRDHACSSTWRRATSPSRAGPAPPSVPGHGSSAATSPCSSAGPIPPWPARATTASSTTMRSASATAIPRCSIASRPCSSNSITVASRLCFAWAQTQPEAFSEKIDPKTGRPKPDLRGAYGLHARAMLQWLTHLQHTRNKSIVFLGILDEKVDDFNRRIFVPQLDGAKTGLELPGIVDQVVAMVELRTPEGKPYRAFVCQTLNDWGYPAKDRSGRLDMVEQPHLGRLIDKIKQPLRRPAGARLEFGRPSAPAADPASPNPSDGTRGA